MTFYQKLHLFHSSTLDGFKEFITFSFIANAPFQRQKKKKKNQHIKAKAQKLKQTGQLDSFSNSLK